MRKRGFAALRGLLLAAALLPPLHAAGPDAFDKSVLTGLLLAARSAAARQPVTWPGYALFSQPVLLYREPPLAVLVGHPKPPPGFYPYPLEEFREYAVFVSTLPLPDLNAAFYQAYPLGGVQVFAYHYDQGETPERIVSTVVHERFHVFQGSLAVEGSTPAFKAGDYTGGLSEADLTAANLALARLERLCLARALTGFAPPEEAARDFAAVRLERRREFGAEWAGLEDNLERNEGLADYFTRRVLEISPAQSTAGAADLADALTAPEDDAYAFESMLHGRLYLTGHAIGRLLDRLGAEWKARVAGGEYPFAVLNSAVPMTGRQRQARLKRVKKEFGYAALLRRAETGLDAAQQARSGAFRDFNAYAGPRLIVRAEYTGKTKVSYTASETFSLGDRTELFVDNPLYEFVSEKARLLVTNATLSVYRGIDERELFEIHLASAPRVYAGGRPAALTAGPRRLEDVVIEEAGVELKAAAALVSVSSGAVAVDIP
jgi:hypothetical protein